MLCQRFELKAPEIDNILVVCDELGVQNLADFQLAQPLEVLLFTLYLARLSHPSRHSVLTAVCGRV